MTTFNLRLNDIIDEKIKHIAKQEQRSKNKQIEYILTEYIKKYELNNGKIKTTQAIPQVLPHQNKA